MKEAWFGNVRADTLAGITVALALIPESIAFSIMVGVDPMVGLYASFCIAIVTAFAGGRPGMISAATGAMAVLMVTLVADYGIEYLFAVTVLTGLIQLLFGLLNFARFLSFIPKSVISGFLNALGIVIFTTQMRHIIGAPWQAFVMIGVTLAIIYGFPRLTRAVPAPLVAIIVMTIAAIALKLDLSTVGDMGKMTRALPVFHLPMVPLTLETLSILLPYALPLAVVGSLESLLTATILDDMTDTGSDKRRELKGQGLANVVAGFFGGMAGCAMIGQSVINVRSGGRGRLSTFVAGGFLLFLILVLADVVARIPMPALVGVMIMVAISTFDWDSLRNIRAMPVSDAVVMITTVVTVVITGDLSKGVLAGIVLSAIVFGWNMSQIKVKRKQRGGRTVYIVKGQLYFASTTRFSEAFQYGDDPEHIVVDFSGSHVWDHSSVSAIDKLIEKYAAIGKRVHLIGLNEASELLLERGGIGVSPGGV